MIDRVRMKEMAKESMRGKKPSVFLVSFAFILITEILNVLSIRVELGMGVVEYYTMLLEGREPFLQSSIGGSLIGFAITIMLTVIGAGFTYYCLRVSRGQQAGFGELFDGFGIFFKVIWLNIVMGFFLFLWALIFAGASIIVGMLSMLLDGVLFGIIFVAASIASIIPAFIAAYRYSFAMYILLDNPDKGAMQCIRESKEMTYGHKGQLFVLDMSFIGWGLLCIVPFVILYVTPYTNVARANYYNELSGYVPEVEYTETQDYREPWEQ